MSSPEIPLILKSLPYFNGMWLLLCHDPSHDFNVKTFSSRMGSIDNYIRSAIPNYNANIPNPKSTSSRNMPPLPPTKLGGDPNDDDDELDSIDIENNNIDIEEYINIFDELYADLKTKIEISEQQYQTRSQVQKRNTLKLYIELLDKYKLYILSLDESKEITNKGGVIKKGGNSITDKYDKMDNQLQKSLNYLINHNESSNRLKNVTKAILLCYDILHESNPSISPYIIFNSYYLQTIVLFVALQNINVEEDIIFNLLSKIVPMSNKIDYTKLGDEPNKLHQDTRTEIPIIGGSLEELIELKDIIQEIQTGDYSRINKLPEYEKKYKEESNKVLKTISKNIRKLISVNAAQVKRIENIENEITKARSERHKTRLITQINVIKQNYSVTDECYVILNNIQEAETVLSSKRKKNKKSLSVESQNIVSKMLQILVNKFTNLSKKYNNINISQNLNKEYLEQLKQIGNDIYNNKSSRIDEDLLEITDTYFENSVNEKMSNLGYMYYLPTKDTIFEENPVIINNSAQTKAYWELSENKVGCSYTTYLDAQGAISSSCTSGNLSESEKQNNFSFLLEEESSDNYYTGGFNKKSKNIGNINYTISYDDIYIVQDVKVNISNLNAVQILSANNTLSRVMSKLINIWSNNEMDWDTRWSYFEDKNQFNSLLTSISEKGVGDFFQEMNVIVKNGGYPTKMVKPRKGTMGDRPSGCRGAYYLLNTINREESIHPTCDIGYYSTSDKSISLYYKNPNTKKRGGSKKRKTKREKRKAKKQTRRRRNKKN